MSGIAGIIHVRDDAVPSHHLEILSQKLTQRGPDGGKVWSNGPTGFCFRALNTTPFTSPQPAVNANGRHVVVFDGFLDAREELAERLKREEFDTRDVKGQRLPDAELVLCAWLAWGEKAVAKLSGDYACACWDRHEKRFFAFRDILGQRPFVYFWDGARFIFASEIQAILGVPDVSNTPNPGFAAELLAGRIQSKTETLYRNIFRLEPAHSLSLLVRTGCEPRIQRYWDLDCSRKLEYISDQEFASQYREHFQRAVASRMSVNATANTLGADFSGGLDSSSILAVAHELSSKNSSKLEAFSMRFPGLRCDEGPYIQAGVEHWKFTHHEIPYEESTREHLMENAKKHRDFPDLPTLATARPLFEAIRKRGIRTVLGGLGGDDLLTGSNLAYADHLRSGNVTEFMRLARGYPSAPGLLRALRRGLSPMLKPKSNATWKTPSYITPEFLRSTNLDERVKPAPPLERFQSLSQQELYEESQSGLLAFLAEMSERACAAEHLEYRYPFYERQLYEFAFALPESQRWQQGRIKWVLRNAMQGRVPEKILQRTDKADFQQPFNQSLLAAGTGEDFEPLGQLGWVNPVQARADFERWTLAQKNSSSNDVVEGWHLWLLCGISVWVRECV